MWLCNSVSGFKDIRDPFRILIVREISLRAFVAQCLPPMFIDRQKY